MAVVCVLCVVFVWCVWCLVSVHVLVRFGGESGAMLALVSALALRLTAAGCAPPPLRRRRVAWERGSLTPERLANMDHPITGAAGWCGGGGGGGGVHACMRVVCAAGRRV